MENLMDPFDLIDYLNERLDVYFRLAKQEITLSRDDDAAAYYNAKAAAIREVIKHVEEEYT